MREFNFKGRVPGSARFRKNLKVLGLGGLLLFTLPCRIFPQKAPENTLPVSLFADYTGPYTLVEISDWSRYDNGKYIGHVFHEVRASIKPETETGAGLSGNSFRYRGNFYVLEETLRDMRQSARPVDEVVPVSFTVGRDGSVTLKEDRGYPSLRGFPAFPAEAVRPGSKWTARGSRVVDPLNTGLPVTVPLIAEYEYRGVELYRDIPVHRISAKYALRYRAPSSRDGCFSGLQGTHTVDILLKTADGLPLLMRDILDETFSWPDGSTVRFKGFTLTFSEGAMPLNRSAMISSIGNALKPDKPPARRPELELEDGKGIDLVSVPEGIRLVVKDIRFIPDSDEMLPEERPRLDIIADALKLAGPGQNFLVEGHTASLGRTAGEMELSVLRAKRMVDELVSRGINANRFIYKGWGGTKPVGDNSNEEGRRLNRRVEITILE
ncbi:MAG: OmpA family protein [Treponema sp.]|jgi:outer membrane protein OmpA-like peptidoglycan-associated protein|nr:OmpA family protein [Treponema sp.]